jgi:hypothetical protein
MHMLDHVEPEAELWLGQAQVKESTNLVLDQGKHRCIQPYSLSFNLNLALYFN